MSSQGSQLRESLLRPPFLICVLLLGAVAVADGWVADYLRVVVRKDPLYLRARLSELDRASLGPYEFAGAGVVDADTLKALGTEEYIFWNLIDTSVPNVLDPHRYVDLGITYYTGASDLPPHTPDVCRKAAGYEPKQKHETKTIQVSTLPSEDRDVPIRVLTFKKSRIYDYDEPSVVYTFEGNGRFVADKGSLMNLLNGPHNRHAYYCKIEVSFGHDRARPRYATREETVEAAQKVFDVLLPLLKKNHLPDWEAAESEVH